MIGHLIRGYEEGRADAAEGKRRKPGYVWRSYGQGYVDQRRRGRRARRLEQLELPLAGE